MTSLCIERRMSAWPPVSFNIELDAYPWQKQEVFKGVNLAGSLSAGWGFHMWSEFDDSGETVWYKYSAAGANALAAANALAENPVFDRSFTPIMTSPISYEMIAEALGHHIPAVSSAVGRTPVLGRGRDFDLNSADFKTTTTWPRAHADGESEDPLGREGWLHSDIKNVSYRFTYRFFKSLLEKGGLK